MNKEDLIDEKSKCVFPMWRLCGVCIMISAPLILLRAAVEDHYNNRGVSNLIWTNCKERHRRPLEHLRRIMMELLKSESPLLGFRAFPLASLAQSTCFKA